MKLIIRLAVVVAALFVLYLPALDQNASADTYRTYEITFDSRPPGSVGYYRLTCGRPYYTFWAGGGGEDRWEFYRCRARWIFRR